jgi:hypothetical protein
LSSKLEERIFTLVLLVVVLGMTVLSLNYRAPARLVPLIVGTATSLIVLFTAATVFVPRVGKWWKGMGKGTLQQFLERDDLPPDPDDEASHKRALEFRVLAWLVALTAMVYLFGFLPSIFVFVFLFLRLSARESWKISLLISGSLWVVVYLVFVLALNIHLYEGILFGA